MAYILNMLATHVDKGRAQFYKLSVEGIKIGGPGVWWKARLGGNLFHLNDNPSYAIKKVVEYVIQHISP